jgi:two-component system chemotaxis sensor kinase CheA
METEAVDTSVRVDAGVLNKLMSLAGELLLARDQFRTVSDRTLAAPPPPASTADPLGAHATLVLFRTPDQGRMAIPLSQVDRIEEFPAAAIFREGGQLAIRYRGTLLPLVEVSSLLPERRARPRRGDGDVTRSERVQVIVHTASGRSVGLMVDRLLDIFEDRIVLEQPPSRAGAAASVLVRDRVTELVDLDAIFRSVAKDFFARVAARANPRSEA